MEYKKIIKVTLKDHPEVNEAWVHQRIADDPSILGLGDIVLLDRERRQPRAGRLDLLLQEVEANKRYEVELQLGSTDESHIMRTIEYWDIERRRYPQYDHCGVIIAEDITSRFLNVISLFNGFIPLIAIQVTGILQDRAIGLHFTKIIDQFPLGLVGRDEEPTFATDRDYWLTRGTKKTVDLVDKMLSIIQKFDSSYQLKYNKFYIGLAKNGVANNFVYFKPKKQWVNIFSKLIESPELTKEIEDSGLDVDYMSRDGKYRIQLREGDLDKFSPILEKIFNLAYKANEE